jgi:hypothetical protein
MHIFVATLLAAIQCFNFSYSSQPAIILEDRELIATEPFPVYQRRDNSYVISNIKPGDRIRSILSDDDGNWILVKTPECWMGWVERKLIDERTHPPSLELGEYVTEGYADLDSDGIEEFIQMVPGSWLEGRRVYINGKMTDVEMFSDKGGFCVVDSLSSDQNKEVLFTDDGSMGALYSYRDGNLVLAEYSWRISRMDGNGVRFENKHLYLGNAKSKFILSPETGRFEEIGQKIYYINMTAVVKNDIHLYPTLPATEHFLTVPKGEIITLLACNERERYPIDDQWRSYYWYLIKTSEDILGWAELRKFKDNVNLNDPEEQGKYLEFAWEDLDGDGVKENIKLDIKWIKRTYVDPETGKIEEYDDHDGPITLHINDQSIDGEEWDICAYGFTIEDIDPMDNLKEIFIEISDASYTYIIVFRYIDGKIIRVGEFETPWRIIDGCIWNRISNGYWFECEKLVIDEPTQQIVTVQQEMNYLGLRIEVRNDFPIYRSPDSTEIAASLKKGETVEILAYDTDYPVKEFDWYGLGAWFRMDYWHLIKLDSGIIGWAQLSTLTKNFTLPQN